MSEENVVESTVEEVEESTGTEETETPAEKPAKKKSVKKAAKKGAAPKKAVAKKAAKKAPAKKAKPTATKEKTPRGPRQVKQGVIYEICSKLSEEDGASVEEVVNHLAKKFKDRDPNTMRTTVKIQVTRLHGRLGVTMKKRKDEKRGTVYKLPKTSPALLLKGVKADA
jgi:hypothetical protein